jgi:hypothetical protein
MQIRRGLLADHFRAVAVKRLSAVEADTSRSNQHEYNGVAELKAVFGLEEPRVFPARFIWLGDEQDAITEDGFVTWYDARARHPSRSEYRLYFPTTSVSDAASEGDVMFIARLVNDNVLVVVTHSASTSLNQFMWLFGIEEQPGFDFEIQAIERGPDHLDFAASYILDELGIEAEEQDADQLDALVAPFGVNFPRTSELSAVARASLPEISARDDPDGALLAWSEREEQLFRRLERHVVAERLRSGFASSDNVDVDGFLNFSLSVQNRRKSRAGWSLEHHVAAILRENNIRFSTGSETENGNKPDFLFPGVAQYKDNAFPTFRLTMLGAKSTLKDRWRQVLSEAERIHHKHLLTLQPGISENQTREMQAKSLNLVIPIELHKTYSPDQQSWLLSLADFLGIVRERQGLG